jgi:hypothetical protein
VAFLHYPEGKFHLLNYNEKKTFYKLKQQQTQIN